MLLNILLVNFRYYVLSSGLKIGYWSQLTFFKLDQDKIFREKICLPAGHQDIEDKMNNECTSCIVTYWLIYINQPAAG
jgi:hypothetical protein